MTTPCIDPFVVATQGVTASPFLIAAQGLGCVAAAVRTQDNAGTLLLRRVADGEAWLTGYRSSSRAGRVRAQGSAAPALTPAFTPPVDGRGVAVGEAWLTGYRSSSRAGRVRAQGSAAPALTPAFTPPVDGRGVAVGGRTKRGTGSRSGAVFAVGHATVAPLRVVPHKTAANTGTTIVSSRCVGNMCFTTYGIVSARGQRSVVPMAISAILAMKRR